MAADTGTLATAIDQLVDHVVLGLDNFAKGVRGEEVDWSTPTPHVEGDRAEALRAAGEDLLAAWAAAPEDSDGPPPEWQCSELAVHTWDLARGLGKDTKDLDPSVADKGASFMERGLTDENRGEAFGTARAAPDGADAYTRLAAFAGARGLGEQIPCTAADLLCGNSCHSYTCSVR